jgi:hypothetical protein
MRWKRSENSHCINEKGSILLELGIAVPLILFISFTGYELSRSALIRLVMSDIVREVTVSSHLCSYRDFNSRQSCFQEVINELQVIAQNRFPPQPDLGLPGMLISLEAYEVIEDQTPGRDNACSPDTIDDDLIANLQLQELVSLIPQNFPMEFKKYTLNNTPQTPQDFVIGNLFPGGSALEGEFRLLACLNGSVMVGEIHLSYEPFLQIDFSSFFPGSRENVEDINWRKEFHAAVIL